MTTSPLGIEEESENNKSGEIELVIDKRIEQRKVILLLETALSDTRAAQELNIKARIHDAGFKMDKARLGTNNFSETVERWILEKNQKPIAVLRWDEHGNVFSSLNVNRRLSTWCHENGIAPLSVDFAYFNHYEGYMIDLLNDKGDSSAYSDIVSMGENFIEIRDIKGKVGEYIKAVKDIYNRHIFYKSINYSKHDYKYAAFTQSLINGCRLMSGNSPEEWMNSLYEALGDDVIFKTQPAPFVKDQEKFEKFSHRVISHRDIDSRGVAYHWVEMNAAISSRAEACIINSSGISHEFILNDIPIIATGKSWFNGLNIFHEPKDWAELKSMVNNGSYQIGPTQKIMRKKWITWWIKHQFLKDEPTTIIQDLIKEFNDKKK